ncbi:MAG: hypothetical protein ACI837_001678 [Crocinitomicaceae bacterium]|jgi:hypothetical protein
MLLTKELIDKINEVNENEVVRLTPDFIVWKEGSSYDVDITNRQFDDLAKLLVNQEDQVYYLVDLSLAGRPTPEMVQIVEERLEPFTNKFKHAAVYAGKNYLIFLGIKFYFIRFNFSSYSGHNTIKSALNSFK